MVRVVYLGSEVRMMGLLIKAAIKNIKDIYALAEVTTELKKKYPSLDIKTEVSVGQLISTD